MKNAQIAFLLFIVYCFSSCGANKVVTEKELNPPITEVVDSPKQEPRVTKLVEFTGKLENMSGLTDELTCHCGNPAYLTDDNTKRRLPLCFGDGVPACEIVTVKGSFQTIVSNPKVENACEKDEIKVFKVESYSKCTTSTIIEELNPVDTSEVIEIKEVIKVKEPDVSFKPIIYLYPTKETKVTVQLDYIGTFIHTYPEYNSQKGWEVIAKPDGELYDNQTGKEYYGLFWEGINPSNYDLSTGFVVEGAKATEFLNEKLAILGLNRREANEFIIYWLPELQKNKYNLVHFAQESYTDMAVLNINPKPETLIRVFMVMRPLENPIDIGSQELKPVERKGFTVVEWGGSKSPKAAN